MRPTLVAALCAILCAGPGAALAQDADDWEFAEDAARELTVATVRYDNGPSIVLTCQAGALTTLLVGMPAGADKLELNATRADGRADSQLWLAADQNGAYESAVAARDARFLRGGGAYAIRSVEGVAPAFTATFDLPSGSANLDRVLTVCGWPLADARDQLARASSAVSFRDPDAPAVRGPRRSRSRSLTMRRRPSPPPLAARQPAVLPAEQQISCIVRNLHLTDCRPHHARAPGAPDAADDLRRLEGVQIYAPDAGPEEGRIMYLHGPRTVTVIDYIATIPAG